MLRVAVLASGRGSNLEALLQWQHAGTLGAEVVLVLCNRAGAGALEVSARNGVEATVCKQGNGQDRESAQMEMSARLEDRGVQLVVTAGYDRVLAPGFVRRWEGKAMNVHPSLLPAFGKSLHAQAEALKHGVKIAGCTVHFITEDVDGGPIIAQAAVPVLPEDDLASLSARILEQEHRLLPEAVRAYARGRLLIQGRTVSYAGG
ncbi:MAG: phosphoribosylglycinamide formyltransferase [Chloroflexota bacterium]|nr:phosphoribosylglycinamide formyltransferase [Chloroflexota bacterium]